MKKIPTLLERDWDNRPKLVLPAWGPGMPPLNAESLVATVKRDGTACAILNGVLYKRADCKRGSKRAKNVPPGWIECQPMDEKGHWPHWAPVGDGPEDRWHREAWKAVVAGRGDELATVNETCELCGPHFQANPEEMERDTFIRHGSEEFADAPVIGDDPVALYAALREFLSEHTVEGIVWWTDTQSRGGVSVCKIKRSDFDLPWPVKKEAP